MAVALAVPAPHSLSAFDLNAIPLAAVERIDVFLDSTAISVGTDAIGGMVNIVLKRDCSELLAKVNSLTIIEPLLPPALKGASSAPSISICALALHSYHRPLNPNARGQ
jgi:hypothetical protein